MCDALKVRKAYKIGASPQKKARPLPADPEDPSADEMDEAMRLERAVLGAMALRGAT